MWIKLAERLYIKKKKIQQLQKNNSNCGNQNLNSIQEAGCSSDHTVNKLVSKLHLWQENPSIAHSHMKRVHYNTLLQQEYKSCIWPGSPQNPLFKNTFSGSTIQRRILGKKENKAINIKTFTLKQKIINQKLQSMYFRSDTATCFSCILISSHQDTYK